MIRKLIICLLAAVFANEFIQWTFFDIEPRTFVASLGFIVAFVLLIRLLMAILFVEHLMRHRDARMD